MQFDVIDKMKKLMLIIVLLVAGCITAPSYLEGTSLRLGAYVPVEDKLYGLQLVSYTSGCLVQVPTNQPFEVERAYASTNSYFWGMIHTVESSDTKARFKK